MTIQGTIAARPLPNEAASPVLPPVLHPSIAECLRCHEDDLVELTQQFGTALNILVPSIATNNFSRLRSVFTARGLAFQVQYAAKVNRSNAFIDAAVASGCGVDLASSREFEDALAVGARGHDLCLTGPYKCEKSLRLAQRTGALVTVDSLEELERLAAWTGGPLRILLRWTGCTDRRSRFGLSRAQVDQALDTCCRTSHLLLRGLSFHLGGYDILERARSIEQSIQQIAARRDAFEHPYIVNMGGGLPVRYLTAKDWKKTDTLSAEHFWPGKTLQGRYPAYSSVAGPSALAAILDAPSDCATGETITTLAFRHNVKLVVEPGRAALDQAGFSVFPVVSTKSLGANKWSVCLLGNSLSLSERWFDCEVLTDPILLKRGATEAQGTSALCLFSGSSCLEDDVFSWRWIKMPQKPEPGDLVVFANTAPYQMDFAETQIHRMHLPRKIVLTNLETFEWRLG